jgi:hypothetical protein
MMTVDFMRGSEARGILVFDKTHVVRNVTIDYAHDWNQGGTLAIAFRNGSQTVVYRSSNGWKSLDVLTGQIRSIGKPKSLPDAAKEGT